MTKLERVKKLLETEEQIITRLGKEVTEDPPLTEARIRYSAYKTCVKIMENRYG